MSQVECLGWWEQDGFGRQPMDPLSLSFLDGQVTGTGCDVIGPFTMQGTLSNDRVAMVKQYLGQHQVDYFGTYDGEGTLQGEWRIDSYFFGPWLIKITASASPPRADEIPGWQPDDA